MTDEDKLNIMNEISQIDCNSRKNISNDTNNTNVNLLNSMPLNNIIDNSFLSLNDSAIKNLTSMNDLNNHSGPNSVYESEIKVLSYIWKAQYYISGHYEFEILLSKKCTSNSKLISQRTIYRRYNDLALLYDGLIKYNPGCLIPQIPEKNFWTNIPLNSNIPIIEKRKIKIENYLNYISKHNYLSHNPVFLIFISDDFEKYRQKIEDGKSLFYILRTNFKEGYTRYLAYLKGQNIRDVQKKKILAMKLNDQKLKNEKNRFDKILIGLEKMTKTMKEEIDNYVKKINAFEKMKNITSILKDSNFRVEINEKNIDKDFLYKKQLLKTESDGYNEMFYIYKDSKDKIEDLYENLIQYNDVVFAMTEIFNRKEQLEQKLKQEKNADFLIGDDVTQNMIDLENEVRRTQIQFFEELSNFQRNIEGTYLVYLEKYFNCKKEEELKINKILNKKNDGKLEQNMNDEDINFDIKNEDNNINNNSKFNVKSKDK